MTKPLFSLILLLAACGSNGGSKNPDAPGHAADAPGNSIDAPGSSVDAPSAPAMITISGTATERSAGGSAPLQGVAIGAYKNTDETIPVATTTTDMSGNFSMTVPTGGIALDGYLKATKTNYVDTYLYPPAPIAADYTGLAVNMLTTSTFGVVANTFCRANQQATQGTIAVEVLDAQNANVAGATVSSSPAAGTYCYDQGGFPSSSATATDTDGVGFMFNVTGQVTVSATKTGATFMSHTVKARAGAFTTTVITE